jgi:agmatine deiminase
MTNIRMPAEWEKHRATWVAWPHAIDDWHDKFETVDWIYAEIVRLLAESEEVELICQNENSLQRAKFCLEMHRANLANVNFHILETNRSWLRDSAPTAIIANKKLAWATWQFNAWAKYDNYHADRKVPELVAKVSQAELVRASRPDNNQECVLEGGAIETDGQGTLIVTEECLQSEIQCRNPGLTKEHYENVFAKYLGIKKTIWIEGGCEGDDTHGHIDDVARFTAAGKVLLAYETNKNELFHEVSKNNLKILESSTDALGNKLTVRCLPMPRAMYFGHERLPASYANFYITNKSVLVPTFNDPNDRIALNMIQEEFPDRVVIGISAVDLVLGFGTLHCLTQQEPLVF